jgi:hypothetical protein
MEKLVCESLEELREAAKPLIRLTPTEKQKEKSTVFGTRDYAIIANGIANVPFKGGKIDLSAFWKILKDRGFSKSEKDLKNILIEVAPILGNIQQYIPGLSGPERSDIKFMAKGLEKDIQDYIDAEIPLEERLPDDYVVRSMDGGTTPAIYRLGKEALTDHDSNMLRAAYAQTHAHEMPGTSMWGVYLGSSPAKVGFVDKNKLSILCPESHQD